jgi:flagellar biosynthetic protein FlhB
MSVAVPVGIVMALVGVAGAVAVGGWIWSWKALSPQFNRLNPITGIGRVLSWRQVGDAAKTSVLALVLGVVGAHYLQSHLDGFAATLTLPLPDAVGHAATALLSGLLVLLAALAAFAIVDVPLQRVLHVRRLRMSHQEAKQEHKELEGNVEVKAKVKARMRELAKRRMLAAVPKADLVVMNPTHYAVALKYDEATMAAPRVVAKGADLLALRIRDIASAAQVPVLQAPPLARALYAHAEIDQEIPARLFAAVAQVLAHVLQLRAAMAGRSAMPAQMPDIGVPPELDPHNPVAGTE